MGKDIYEMAQPVKEKKAKKPVNKDSLIIGIVVAVVLLLTVGIVAYYFFGINSQVLVTYKDGGKITRGKFEAVYRYWAPTLAYYGYNADDLPELIVDEILLNEVMYKEATANEYKLTDEDKETVDKQFSNTDNIDALVAQGVDVDRLKDFFYKNSVVTAYLNDKQKAVTTEDVKTFIIANEGEKADLNMYKTSHILFAFTSSMTDEDKATLLKEAKDVLAKVKKGDDFATLAKEHSDDYGTAQNGGKFDMANNETVVEEYRKAVLTLKAGKVYGSVVETTYGYHIIKLDSIEKDGRLTSEDDISTYINSYISDRISEVFDPEDENSKVELEKVKELALKFDAELGITHQTASEE